MRISTSGQTQYRTDARRVSRSGRFTPGQSLYVNSGNPSLCYVRISANGNEAHISDAMEGDESSFLNSSQRSPDYLNLGLAMVHPLNVTVTNSVHACS